MDRYLYRGVNHLLYEESRGRLIPKAFGHPFKANNYFGGDTYFRDGSVFGPSKRNAVIKHQRDSSKHPTSGVSTTPIYENARKYATHNGKYTEGYVFTIDVQLLDQHGVNIYHVAEHATKPTIPNDKEVILVADDFGILPKEIIIKVEKL